MNFASNEDLYDFVRALADWLRGIGHLELAQDLTDALASGSTSGEVLGATGMQLKRISDAGVCDGSIHEETLESALRSIRRALGGSTFF